MASRGVSGFYICRRLQEILNICITHLAKLSIDRAGELIAVPGSNFTLRFSLPTILQPTHSEILRLQGLGALFWGYLSVGTDMRFLSKSASDVGAQLQATWIATHGTDRHAALNNTLSAAQVRSWPLAHPHIYHTLRPAKRSS